jgi:S1-C subfamily serine protease
MALDEKDRIISYLDGTTITRQVGGEAMPGASELPSIRSFDPSLWQTVLAPWPKRFRGRVAGTRWATLMIATALFAAACGGAAEETTTTTTTTTTTDVEESSTTTAADTTTTTEPSGAASGLKGVRGAVVRIVAEGSFVDPEAGLVSNTAGSGSGFIIDPSGLAVTNNHVVTGAAFLQVHVEGEDEPRNAKILGVSECSDLAVIDIDGAGFQFLEWYEEDITTGTEVFAAGFPLGDPEYTLTEGIVSKEEANGESDWSSIDSVIEHTAQILPGNSGGPLVTDAGRVVGVNYASVNDLDLQCAISRDEVARILDDLIAGEDVASIGVNGTAVLSESLSGIWVAATESGSPAANLGITGGDIITEMERLILATDGTMADYCDILRSHESDDPLAVESLHFDTEEVLEGMLNGDEELTLAFSFAKSSATTSGATLRWPTSTPRSLTTTVSSSCRFRRRGRTSTAETGPWTTRSLGRESPRHRVSRRTTTHGPRPGRSSVHRLISSTSWSRAISSTSRTSAMNAPTATHTTTKTPCMRGRTISGWTVAAPTRRSSFSRRTRPKRTSSCTFRFRSSPTLMSRRWM